MPTVTPSDYDVAAATEALQNERSPHRRDLMIADHLCVVLAYATTVLLTYGAPYNELTFWQWLGLVTVPALCWGPVAVSGNAYAWYQRRFLHDELAGLAKIIVAHFALVTILYYNTGAVPTRRAFLFVALGLLVALTGTVRFYFRNRVNKYYKPFNYVIVGGQPRNTDMLRHGFEYAFHGKARLLGRFGNSPHPNIPTLGDYRDLRTFLLSTHMVKKVVFVYSALSPEEEVEIMEICVRRFIDLEVMPRETHLLRGGFKMQHHGDTPLLTQVEDPLSRLIHKTTKRVFDLVVSSVVVFGILPWLIPIVAVAIKLESRGPVFFRQVRSGYLNQPFRMWKFRTMTVNEQSDSQQATAGDARVTRVGAFLRRTSLDEFPQFINAFLGQMSVVGPRPHMIKHTDHYARLIETYLVRHKVKPGITGWAQVNGLRGPTGELELMKARVQHDVWYMQNWSIWLDLRCVAQTVYNAVRGEENAV